MLIDQIWVKGYKSLVDATLHVRPLTLLAGPNSSGKSSILQPLLLIKQTMEAPYQPAGALVLSGAHVQAETAGELVSKSGMGALKNTIQLELFGVEILDYNGVIKKTGRVGIVLKYAVSEGKFALLFQEVTDSKKRRIRLVEGRYSEGSGYQLPEWLPEEMFLDKSSFNREETVLVNGFLQVYSFSNEGRKVLTVRTSRHLEESIGGLMHIPGLRGKPERSYPAAFFNDQIKGTFDLYAAGTISQWQQQGNTASLLKLNEYLVRLGLTNSVEADVKNANAIELRVGRLPVGAKSKAKRADLVNIADVGIGVSQVLPILVALLAAQDGQLVYVEQPELHLHPRAQVVMAELLAEAANRGVRVIVETHSSLLLLTVQTLVAAAKIKHTDVALHWFARDAKGATQVTYVQPDEDGAYGEWPEDFGDVELKAQRSYLDAVTKRRPKRQAQPTGI